MGELGTVAVIHDTLAAAGRLDGGDCQPFVIAVTVTMLAKFSAMAANTLNANDGLDAARSLARID